MAEYTTNFTMLVLEENEDALEVGINKAFRTLDVGCQIMVFSITNTPDPSPTVDSTKHIVGENPTGDWVDKAHAITYYATNALSGDDEWLFITPHDGMTAWVGDEAGTGKGYWYYYTTENKWTKIGIQSINGHILRPKYNAGVNQDGPTHTYGLFPDCPTPEYTVEEFSVQIDSGGGSSTCAARLLVNGSLLTGSEFSTEDLDDYLIHTVTPRVDVSKDTKLELQIWDMSNLATHRPPINFRFSIHYTPIFRAD